MKNIIIGILLTITVIFGGLYFQQTRKTTQAEASVASLQKEVSDLKTSLAQQEKHAASLRDQLHNTLVESAANAGEAAQLQQVLTNRVETDANVKTNAKPANAFAEMFKSPEMRDMIKNQQKAVLGPMIDKNYAEFIASLQMTPEQSAGLKDLITKKMLVDAGMGMDMLSGDLDADKRAELVKQARADKEAIDAEIKQFLGADNYTQYQSYEKTLPDRMVLGQFKDQLASGTGALNAGQEQQLMQAMSTERQAFKFTTDYNDQSKFNGDFASFFTEEKMNTFFTEQEQLSQRYLARAQSILSGDQLAAYQKFLTGQREMQKAAMKMAAQMFGPQKSGQ
jgi:uncharacterized protein YxeA